MATPARKVSAIPDPAGGGARDLARRPRCFEVRLHSRSRRALFLLATLLPAAGFLALAARVGLAGFWGDSLQIAALRRAVALDAGNAQLRFNLGTAYLWAEGGNPAAAVMELRQAARLNPRVAAYWSALAKACYAAGQAGCADESLARAARLAPAKPRYAWEAGLHYAITGRPRAAWPHLRRLLELQPERAVQVFELLWRTGNSPESVWRNLAQPAAAGVRLAFLGFLLSQSQFSAAESYWAELAAARAPLPLPPAAAYMEQLLRCRRYRAAAQVWKYLQAAGVVSAAGEASLAFNGGFEQPPLGAAFDWQGENQRYVVVDFADPGAYAGRRALRLDFTVPDNSEYQPAWQLVPVVPGHSYELTAWARGQNLTSDSGPRLRVEDPRCLACLSRATPGTVGTTSWRRLALAFTAPAQAEVLRISVWRPRSRAFPMEISGQFWLDDVMLRAVSENQTQAGGRRP